MTPAPYETAHNIIGRFNDAINRRDAAAFRTLWTSDGVFDMKTMATTKGAEEIADTVFSMLEGWEFFFQMSGQAVVERDGDVVLARSPMWEFGRSHDGQSYSSHALNVDRIVQSDGSWRLERRIWHPLRIDSSDLGGTAVELPADLAV